MVSTSTIDVDLTAIGHNLRVIRGILERGAGQTGGGSPGLCAVLKADAYGLGAGRVAKRLATGGVDLFAVFTPAEAMGLVDAAVMTPILMLLPVEKLERSDGLYRAAMRGQLHFTVSDARSLDAMIETADRQGLSVPLHLQVDTGMSRGGASPEDASELVERISAHPRLKLAGVFDHFSSADSDAKRTERQAGAFSDWLESNDEHIPGDCVIHESNTFGMLRSRHYHRQMVRVGLALFGHGLDETGDPEDLEFHEQAAELRPCFRWTSSIIQTKWIGRGTGVSYGATWKAKRKTLIGLVPVGYADGYPLALSNRAEVGVETLNGTRYAPVIGRVTMDQLVIDLSGIDEAEVPPGTSVELIGNERDAPTHIATLAEQAGTISHELMCRFSSRIARRYVAVERPAAGLQAPHATAAAAG